MGCEVGRGRISARVCVAEGRGVLYPLALIWSACSSLQTHDLALARQQNANTRPTALQGYQVALSVSCVRDG